MSDTNANYGWFAIYTRHQHEKTVHQELVSKGLDSFLPLYSTVRQWKDRAKRLLLPLIPCYVFVREPLTEWLPVLSTPGVHSVVSFGGRPATIPSAEIEAIRRAIESPAKVEAHPYLSCGDRVRVTSGPLRDLEGILVRKKSSYKLLLSIEMLQRSVAVEIEAHMVERIEARASVSSLDPVK